MWYDSRNYKSFMLVPPTTTTEEAGDPPVKVIDRAARLLRALGNHPYEGASLTELARETTFGKATTHRLLAALIDAGFVFQDIGTKRYQLGSALALLGRNAMTQFQSAACRESLETLAQATDDTVFAQIPEGSAAVCIGRATGSFPIRTLTLNEGDRRPLGVGAGSLALLAAMPDSDVAKIIERNHQWLKDFPEHGAEVILRLVEETRRNGFAFNSGRIVSGMHAVGVPVLGPDGRAIASLSAAAITERLAPARAEKIIGLLKKEATRLAIRLVENMR